MWSLSCSDVVPGQTRTYSAGLRIRGGNSSSLPGYPHALCPGSGTPSAQGRTRGQTSLLRFPVCVQTLGNSWIFILFQLFSPQMCQLIVKSHLLQL